MLKDGCVHMKNLLPLVFPRMNTSVANGSSYIKLLYGIPMNTCIAPPQPPPRGTQLSLDPVGPSKSHLGPSGYVTDRPTYFVRPSNPTQARAQSTQVEPYTTGPSEYNPGPFGPVAYRSVPYTRPSRYAYTKQGAA
jgi:hypothetical protein